MKITKWTLGMKWKCDKITSSNQKPKRKGKNLRVTYNTFFFSYRTITPRACLLEEGRLAWSCGIDLMVMLLGFDISPIQSQIVLACQNLISEFQTLTINEMFKGGANQDKGSGCLSSRSPSTSSSDTSCALRLIISQFNYLRKGGHPVSIVHFFNIFVLKI